MELKGRYERINCNRITCSQLGAPKINVRGRKTHVRGPLKDEVLCGSNRKRPERLVPGKVEIVLMTGLIYHGLLRILKSPYFDCWPGDLLS
jgi:hypothetical protein